MKIVLIIIATFFIAILTTALLDIDFFSVNPVRYALIVLLVLIELLTGFFYIKSEIK